MSEFRLTGGCQCGAVRYALLEEPTGAHICHCRMCQKAFGSFFAPLTGLPMTAFEITRGELAIFKSSDPTERGFCRNCGTPLTIHDVALAAHCCLDRLARRAGEGRAEEAVRGRGTAFLVRKARRTSRRQDHGGR